MGLGKHAAPRSQTQIAVRALCQIKMSNTDQIYKVARSSRDGALC